MDFIALDYETANADQSTICQVGLARFKNGKLVETIDELVNPDDYFDPINTSIHGIDETIVKDAPILEEYFPKFVARLDGSTIISHTAFDRVATTKTCEWLGIPAPNCEWLDSARIARRAWPEKFGARGYGLKNVAKELGIEFCHHNATEDARACGEVVLRAIDHTGIDLADWCKRVKSPIFAKQRPTTSDTEPNPNGPFFGSVISFTGALTISRSEAAEKAALIGFKFSPGVTKKTNTLVIGDQDATKLGGKNRSSKHLRAQQLINAGQDIDILTENDFLRLLSLD